MQVNPLVAYSTWIAIKLHFADGSYDAFKYNFKGPQRRLASFAKSRDRFLYEKIARRYKNFDLLVEYFLANYLDDKTWIGDMSDSALLQWQAKMQRMTYQFSADMKVMYEYAEQNGISFDECLHVKDSSIPIIDLYTRSEIQIESVVIIDRLVGFLSRINKDTVSDPLGLTSDAIAKIQRYSPFIKARINIDATKKIIINLFTPV